MSKTFKQLYKGDKIYAIARNKLQIDCVTIKKSEYSTVPKNNYEDVGYVKSFEFESAPYIILTDGEIDEYAYYSEKQDVYFFSDYNEYLKCCEETFNVYQKKIIDLKNLIKTYKPREEKIKSILDEKK
jgi:hypothetical protein